MFLYSVNSCLHQETCKKLISLFEVSDFKQPGILYGPDGMSSKGSKKSTDITFTADYLQDNNWGPILKEVIDVLERRKLDYFRRHELALSNVDAFDISPTFNMQRYLPGEGFTGWHCERASNKFSNRILVWMIYLNTVTDGGETEFYYQHHFEEPVEGKLLIWPSDWMYLHRGVPSFTQTKYILTGWYNMLNRKTN